MESWMPFFVVVAATAIVLQTLILAAMFVQIRRVTRRMEQIAEEVQVRINPILSRVQMILDEAQPRITSIISDTAEITHTARMQVQRADRVLTEALDRLRMQLIHADQILTGVLETVEDTGAKLRRTVWGPVQSVSAVVRGIQTALEFYRGRRRPGENSPSPVEQQDESLFI